MSERSRPSLSHPTEPDAHAPSRGVEPTPEPDEIVTFSFRGPKSLRRRLRVLAAETDRSVQDISVEALKEYLERHGR